MVTFAQAQERAEEWINGDVPGYQHREVRVREFELGFVVWAEDRADGPRSDGGAQRLVIARDSGDATLWPGLAVGEVIRRYEEQYGAPDAAPAASPAPPARVDLNQTSFLLTPPEWLQEAADKMGIPDRRAEAGTSGGSSGSPADAPSDAVPGPRGVAAASSGAGVPTPPAPSAHSDAGAGAGAWPAAGQGQDAAGVPASATPWAGTDTNADAGDDRSVPLPATVFAPPLSGLDEGGTPPPGVLPDAKTALMSGGSQLPPTAMAPALSDPNPGPPSGGFPQAPGGPGAPGSPATPPPAPASYGYPQGPGGAPTPPPGAPVPGAQPPAGPGGPVAPERPLPPHAGDIADAATSKAQAPPR
ncbi:hypothetical protein ABZS97_33755, partial [Streptomyces sp. NPDC005485]